MGEENVPYSLAALLQAMFAHPQNAGIFIGNASIPKEDRLYDNSSNPLPEVEVTGHKTNYGWDTKELAEEGAKWWEKELNKIRKDSYTRLEQYMLEHPSEFQVYRKIGAIPEMSVKGEVTWHLPTLEYEDLAEAYPEWNHMAKGVNKRLIGKLQLGNGKDATKPSAFRDRTLGRNWYYVQCAQAGNHMSQKLHAPTTGHAWTRHGLYGDSLIFDNSDLKYEYLEDQKLPPSQRRLLRRDLQDGDFVDIKFDLTSNARAAATGRGNSHTGTIVQDDTGYPWVVDNVSGELEAKPLEKVFTNKGLWHVERVYRPGTYAHPYSNATVSGWKPEHGTIRKGSWAEQYLPKSWEEIYNLENNE